MRPTTYSRPSRPIDTTATTLAVPIAMPSMVSSERPRWPERPSTAKRSRSLSHAVVRLSIGEMNDALGSLAHLVVVRDQHDGRTVAVQVVQDVEDLLRRARVERAG